MTLRIGRTPAEVSKKRMNDIYGMLVPDEEKEYIIASEILEDIESSGRHSAFNSNDGNDRSDHGVSIGKKQYNLSVKDGKILDSGLGEKYLDAIKLAARGSREDVFSEIDEFKSALKSGRISEAKGRWGKIVDEYGGYVDDADNMMSRIVYDSVKSALDSQNGVSEDSKEDYLAKLSMLYSEAIRTGVGRVTGTEIDGKEFKGRVLIDRLKTMDGVKDGKWSVENLKAYMFDDDVRGSHFWPASMGYSDSIRNIDNNRRTKLSESIDNIYGRDDAAGLSIGQSLNEYQSGADMGSITEALMGLDDFNLDSIANAEKLGQDLAGGVTAEENYRAPANIGEPERDPAMERMIDGSDREDIKKQIKAKIEAYKKSMENQKLDQKKTANELDTVKSLAEAGMLDTSHAMGTVADIIDRDRSAMFGTPQPPKSTSLSTADLLKYKNKLDNAKAKESLESIRASRQLDNELARHQLGVLRDSKKANRSAVLRSYIERIKSAGFQATPAKSQRRLYNRLLRDMSQLDK